MKHLLTLALTLSTFASFAQNQYRYTVDIANIKNDQVAVTLKTPAIKSNTTIYSFAKAIPGSYARKDFGRFISELLAFDKNGKKLKFKKLNDNQFQIENATTLDKISYKVSDTWDTKHRDFIFQPGGSNIEAGLNVVMNNHAFYGYFEGMTDLPIEIEITKPGEFYGATHLDVDRTSATRDIITAKNFVYLADNPIIYAKPDTTSYYEGKTKINIMVYSATGKISSKRIAGYLKPISVALNKFFNGLPVDSYQFLYYFEESGKGLTDHDKGEGGHGALEHNYSSLYYLPEMAFEERLVSMINDVSTHEFLHIQTPLNLHSDEIAHFDFTAPKMSQHLWLYEGVTEYFAQLLQVQTGLADEAKFFTEMREKVNAAVEFGDFSMTEMSKRVLEDAWQKKYNSVYNRGALLALMLDIDIREKTNGAKDLKQVIATLSKKYGPNKPFNDATFIDEFVEAAHPDVRNFMNKYIIGGNPLPYPEYFDKIGYEFALSKNVPAYFPGKIGLRYDEAANLFIFDKIEENALGIKNGDIIKKIDGVPVGTNNIDKIWNEYVRKNTAHPTMSVTVLRNGQETVLQGKIYTGYIESKNYIGPAAIASAQQKALLDKLMGR